MVRPTNKTYYIKGYDKDADVYEQICSIPAYDARLTVARAIAYWHYYEAEIHRQATGEPFDWFVITDENDEIIKTITQDDVKTIW